MGAKSRSRMIQRILCATDFSPCSRAAFDKALELAKRASAKLFLLHVLVPPSPFLGKPPSSYLELQARAQRVADRRLTSALAKARNAGVRVEAQMTDGMPAEVILRQAARRRADLIVMGTHGRSGPVKFFLGSIAARVVPSASCPVLTVRGR